MPEPIPVYVVLELTTAAMDDVFIVGVFRDEATAYAERQTYCAEQDVPEHRVEVWKENLR